MTRFIDAIRGVPKVEPSEWAKLGLAVRWAVASRASVLIMTLTSAAVGGLLALADKQFNGFYWLVAVFGLMAAHATNNLINDYVDSRRGIDKDNYYRARYGTHVLEAGLLTTTQMRAYIGVTGVFALACGTALITMRGGLTLPLMLAGAFFVLFYTWPLKTIGLGEPAVLLVWGPLMIGGCYFVAAGHWSWEAALVGLVYGLGPTVVLFGKHIDKLDADREKAVYTLPVLLGEALAKRTVLGLILLQYLLLVGLVSAGILSVVVLLVLVSIPTAQRAAEVFQSPRPVECPENYPRGLWPLWYSHQGFLLNKRFSILLVLGLLAQLFIGGSPRSPMDDNELIVLTSNAPSNYFVDRDGNLSGPEYDLMKAFAESQGWRVTFRLYNSVEEILEGLANGEGDIAAAGLSELDSRKQLFLASDSYQQVSDEVVCRRGGANPSNLNELADISLMVRTGSSHAEALASLQSSVPGLSWQQSAQESRHLLQGVWEKEIECTVADSNVVALNRRFHPELTVPMKLPGEQSFVWYLPEYAGSLRDLLNDWLNQYRETRELGRVLERYYGQVEKYDYVDTARFLRAVKTRLPTYRDLFIEQAEEQNVHWTLLAAMAYQESHWKAGARSPTGVRGMMMLTQTTAEEMGVSDRLDPMQSIAGGAKYLVKLRNRLPDNITEPDRTWLALAAYNIGYGHLKDAMTLARAQEKDPGAWADIKAILPLLARKQYYRDLKYGYARGEEPVIYVSRIRNYEDLLVQTEVDVQMLLSQ